MVAVPCMSTLLYEKQYHPTSRLSTTADEQLSSTLSEGSREGHTFSQTSSGSLGTSSACSLTTAELPPPPLLSPPLGPLASLSSAETPRVTPQGERCRDHVCSHDTMQKEAAAAVDSASSVTNNTTHTRTTLHNSDENLTTPQTAANCAIANESQGCQGLTFLEARRRLAVLSKEQLLELAAYSMFQSSLVARAGDAILDSDPASRRVMVRGLAYTTTNATFCTYFSAFGELENAAIIRHPDGRSQGYGFLIYRHRSAAEDVVQRCHLIDDRIVTAKLAADNYTEFSRDQKGQNVSTERRKLFIRNLCHGITQQILEQEFAVYGPIEDCAIVRTMDGVSRGYAFITFARAADALRAAQTPFRVVNGWVVFVSFATGRGRQQQQPAKPSLCNSKSWPALQLPKQQEAASSGSSSTWDLASSIDAAAFADQRRYSVPTLVPPSSRLNCVGSSKPPSGGLSWADDAATCLALVCSRSDTSSDNTLPPLLLRSFLEVLDE